MRREEYEEVGLLAARVYAQANAASSKHEPFAFGEAVGMAYLGALSRVVTQKFTSEQQSSRGAGDLKTGKEQV